MHVGGAGSKPWGVGIENMQRGLVQGIRTGSWYLERVSGLAYIRVYDPFILISLIHFSLYLIPSPFSLNSGHGGRLPSPAVLMRPARRLADLGGGATAPERKLSPFLFFSLFSTRLSLFPILF